MLAYIDSSVWITRFEGIAFYQDKIENSLHILEQEGWVLCISEVVLLEALFKPYHKNQKPLITLYNRIFAQMMILSNYDNIFRDALSIAIEENLRGIDSVHIALALHYGCEKFVTTDNHFKKLRILPPLWINLNQNEL